MKQGWTYKKLGELGTIVTGSTPSTKIKEYYCSNDYCFIKPSDLPAEGYQIIVESENYISSKGYEVSRKLPKGSVLVSCIGIIGKTAILGMDACTNQQINAIIPNEYVNNKFLAYSILSQRYVLSSVANAPVVPLINKSDFSKVEIPLPPLSVQHSIVSELDKINELIRLKKEQLKDYDNLAQSIFYEMFGDPVVNEKGWEVKKFSEVASFKNGLNFGKNENGYSYKILGVGDFKNNYVVNSSLLEYINLNDELSSDYFLKPEDIVFVRSNGSKELVGRCVSVDCTEPTTYSGFCIRCRLDENSGVLPMYLLYICKNKGIREYLTQSGRGCNISNVNQKILNSTDIIIPPVSKQELFIQRIELIEQQKDEIKSTIADLETLLASRMQYWFD